MNNIATTIAQSRKLVELGLPAESTDMIEEWRDIEGYEGFYQISSFGRVKSLRGKASHNGEWLFGYLINICGNYHILGKDDMREDGHHVAQDSDRPTWVDPATVGQFTGLHDKNGKKIYEGDIVQWGDSEHKIKQVVEFRNGAFGYVYDTIGSFVPYAANTNFDFAALGTDKRFEVIGNIHDNPELMKGGEQ